MPLYRNLINPASTTGSFEASIRELQAWKADTTRDVLVLGDTRIYAGLDPAMASENAGGLRFLNAGIPGTNPRCWFFYDRAIDPTAKRFRAIVIPFDSYTDDTSAIGSLDADDHQSDLNYIVFETHLGDLATVADSFGNALLRSQIVSRLVLRGPLLTADINDFLQNPNARLTALRTFQQSSFHPETWHPFPTSTATLRVDFAKGTIRYPTWMSASERTELNVQLLRTPEASPTYAAYRERWLLPLLERYRQAHVPIIFLRIPTRPTHRVLPPPPNGSVIEMARQVGASIVPQDAYVALEKPALFADHDHLNRTGSQRFSALLGHDVASAIARPIPSVGHERHKALSPLPLTSMRKEVFAALALGAPIEFQSLDFAIFFIALLSLFYTIPRRLRSWLLFVASYYFYVRWNTFFVVVIAVITLSDYLIARAIEPSEGPRRRALLVFGVFVNLAFLGTFKYLDFASGTVASILRLHPNPWYIALIVPVGISFHTFQSISYLVDVERRRTSAITSLLDYAVYIAFFPQLLSGPIVRAERFFHELNEWRAPSAAKVETGVTEIALGLIKKLAIADQMAPSVDTYFNNPTAYPGTSAAWGAAFAFAMQIYFDFSGYTDIAIGCARLLGFDFPANFNRPYFAQTITAFWRRWNMTLSSWLRDYVYIPLGGNRRGTFATYRNLVLTMLLAGLWHGANWTFVVWGGYHGALLAVERRLGLGSEVRTVPIRLIRWLGTFALVTVGWVLFRAATFGDAFVILRSMLTLSSGSPPLSDSWPWPLLASGKRNAPGVR